MPLKPGSPKWHARKEMLLAEEYAQPVRWFYSSYADEKRGGFLGATIVQARGAVSANQVTHQLGINPGGQVLTIQVPGHITPPAKYCNRLLSRAELDEMDREMESGGTSPN